MSKLAELVEKIHPGETLENQMLVIVYELGDLAKCIQRMSVYPNNVLGYKAEAKKAVADLIAQIHLFCYRMGWNFYEVEALGLKALEEAIRERAEKL